MKLQLQFLYFVVAAASYNVAVAEVLGYTAYNESSKCVTYKALPAGFEPQLPDGLTGYFMRVIPLNASHAIENPPAPRKASKTYIALIQRCGCSLVGKVFHVHQAGCRTTLVYNADSEQLATMMAGDKETPELIKVPSLFAGEWLSLHLKRTSQCKRGAYIRVLPSCYLNPCHHIAKILQAILIMQDFRATFYSIMTTLSIMVGLILYKRAPKMKLHTYKQGDKYETCVICLAEYKKGDHLNILCCSHAYHSACIDTWFQTQSGRQTCPICKQVVNTYE